MLALLVKPRSVSISLGLSLGHGLAGWAGWSDASLKASST